MYNKFHNVQEYTDPWLTDRHLQTVKFSYLHTTPSIPYKVKSMLTLVLVVMFITGRMALRLKTGVRACSSAGWLGSEQFTWVALHKAVETIQKSSKKNASWCVIFMKVVGILIDFYPQLNGKYMGKFNLSAFSFQYCTFLVNVLICQKILPGVRMRKVNRAVPRH